MFIGKKKKTRIVEIVGIILSIISILVVLNADDIQKIIYDDNVEIPFHNIFYEDRELSLSNGGDKIVIYDGIAIICRDINTNKEDFVISLESRGIVKDFVWSEDDKHIVYLKDEFNNKFSLWTIDVEEKTNIQISNNSEYVNLSWLNSISSDNFIYAKYIIGRDKATYHSANLDYFTSKIINDEEKYDEIAFDLRGNQILGLKASKLSIDFYDPSTDNVLGSISISDSASAGYFEMINNKAYFTMSNENIVNLYSYDGDKLLIVRKDIDKNLKVEKTILVNDDFAGIYGVDRSYEWIIEDDYKENFKFLYENDVNYRFLNSSLNGERMLVRPTKDFDPGDICLVDINTGKVKEILNIKHSIDGDRLYHTESINFRDLDNKNSSDVNFTLTLGNFKFSEDKLFVILDSDLSMISMENKYDPLVQAMVDRGINIVRLSYDYSNFKDQDFTIEMQSQRLISDIESVKSYLKKQKNIDTSEVHLVSKGKSALLASNVISINNIDIQGLILLEPIFDIKNSPYTSTIEKSIISSLSDYPNIELYTENYDTKGANLTVYLNTEVTDSKLTNEFYKKARKTTDHYLYKKAGVYNEHSIGSTYFLKEYFEKFMKE